MKKAVKFLLEHGAGGLLLDPGMCKTSITLAAFKILKTEGMSRGMVVFCPLYPAHTTWPNEVRKWSDFNELDIVVLHGPKKDRLVREKHDIYMINYEAIPWLFNRAKVGKAWKYFITDAGKELLKNVDMVVFDELHNMKNSDTLRFALIKPWLDKFLRRWGLTGSPASNGLLDLFGQCYVLDGGRTLGKYVTHYKSEYFVALDQNGWNWALQKGAEKRIYDRLKPLMLRLDAEDYIKLPRQMDHYIKFDLPDKVRKTYDEMEKELLTTLDAQLIVAPNKGSAVTKCRQICSGALYTPTRDPITGIGESSSGKDRPWQLVHDCKIELIKSLAEELQGKQLLVAYEYNHDLARLLKAFPNTPYIGSGVPLKKGVAIEAAWNRGEIPLLFGQPASIGVGLNLQGSNACHIAWFTITWNQLHYDQLNRRLRRTGSGAEIVHVYHLAAKNTVEESVVASLRTKWKTQMDLFNAIKTKKRLS